MEEKYYPVKCVTNKKKVN